MVAVSEKTATEMTPKPQARKGTTCCALPGLGKKLFRGKIDGQL